MTLSLPLDFIEVVPVPVYDGPVTVQGAKQRGETRPIVCPDCGGAGTSKMWMVEETFYLVIHSCPACGWRRTI